MNLLGRSLASLAMSGSLVAGVVVPSVVATGCGDDRAVAPHRTLRATYGLPAVTGIDPGRTALVLVDFQRELVDGELALPRADAAVSRARTLLRWARDHGITVVHVRQLASRADAPLFRPGSRGVLPVPELVARGGELEVTKPVAGAFSRTDLDARLRAYGVDTVIVAGFMTHLAVDSTARDATVLGYHTIVAADATATRALPSSDGGTISAEIVQSTALAALADRFADVMTSEDLIALPVERGAIAQLRP
jgi:nicotinamidase-related amidase